MGQPKHEKDLSWSYHKFNSWDNKVGEDLLFTPGVPCIYTGLGHEGTFGCLDDTRTCLGGQRGGIWNFTPRGWCTLRRKEEHLG